MNTRSAPLARAVMAVSAFLFVGACETMPPLQPDDWPGPMVPERGATTTVDEGDLVDPSLPDPTLRAAVEERLRVDGVVAPGAIEVAVEDGVVTLSGTTRDLLVRDRAIELTRDVRGVRGVVDRVEVRPPERRDDVIERDVRAALEASEALGGEDLSVTVENGAVTLEGTLRNLAEARHAIDLARGVVGVRHVFDRLDLEIRERRSDEEIRASLERSLQLDARFAGDLLDVDVSEGLATLSGSVDSAAERDVAADHALAAGARFVDVRELEVGAFADDEPPRPTGRVADDELVEDAVRSALARDPRLDDDVVRVEVSNGVATLRGTVRTVAAKESASERAREARGVVDVRNLVEVSAAAEVSDSELSARVEDALSRDPWLFDSELTVLVDDGEVTLAGELPTRYARARARSIVSAVEGVDGVLDRLSVRPSTQMSDEELRASVLEELFWNPNVDPGNLVVEVEGGVVWLGGEARDILAAASARESAYSAGARNVVNQIEVPTAPPDVRTTIEDDPDFLRRDPFVPETPFNEP